jgi:hypothetical protein
MALIAFCLVWFGAIVPGHQRGVVLLPGVCEEGVSNASASCCAAKHRDSDAPVAPSKCAICYYTLTLSSAPVFALVVPRLGLLEVLPPVAPESVRALESRPLYYGRAPPAMRFSPASIALSPHEPALVVAIFG